MAARRLATAAAEIWRLTEASRRECLESTWRRFTERVLALRYKFARDQRYLSNYHKPHKKALF